MVPVPGGRSGKTLKAQSQSGCGVSSPYWPLLVTATIAKVVSAVKQIRREFSGAFDERRQTVPILRPDVEDSQ